MGIQIIGNSGVVAEVDGTTFRALRVTSRPADYGTLGFYQAAPLSGAIAAGLGANAEIFQIRWTDATRFCVLQLIALNGMRATTAFAAGGIDFTLTIARGWTAPGTGGATVTLTGNNQKLRTSMGTSLMGEIRVITTAGLGAGTKTLDAEAIGRITTHSSGGVGSATPIIGSIYLPVYELFGWDAGEGMHPIVLATNEGVALRATVPATGVWNIGFRLKWSELTAF